MHADIRWHPELREWFCVKCDRTSQRKTREEARRELDNYPCEMPTISPDTVVIRQQLRCSA
jgi:hypothetical protein